MEGGHWIGQAPAFPRAAARQRERTSERRRTDAWHPPCPNESAGPPRCHPRFDPVAGLWLVNSPHVAAGGGAGYLIALRIILDCTALLRSIPVLRLRLNSKHATSASSSATSCRLTGSFTTARDASLSTQRN